MNHQHRFHGRISTANHLGHEAWEAIHHPIKRFVPERYAKWGWTVHLAYPLIAVALLA